MNTQEMGRFLGRVSEKLKKFLKIESKMMPYVLVRTARAGVFVGYLKERRGQEVDLIQSRWIWYWDGAATIFQLSQEGTNKPQNCKFPMEVPEHTIFEVIDIIPMTEKAKKSIAEVPIWRA